MKEKVLHNGAKVPSVSNTRNFSSNGRLKVNLNNTGNAITIGATQRPNFNSGLRNKEPCNYASDMKPE